MSSKGVTKEVARAVQPTVLKRQIGNLEAKRALLAEDMLCYFGEICPALAARCEVAIVDLSPLARREVAGRLQTLRVVTNETNLELAAARVAVARRQVAGELLLDRALASVEHLSEVAQTMTRWMDELLNAGPHGQSMPIERSSAPRMRIVPLELSKSPVLQV
jgi:hypothetical protein